MFSILYIMFSSLAVTLLHLLAFLGVLPKKLNHFWTDRKQSKAVPAGKVTYWIHAASLGEYEMALPIIQKLIAKGVKRSELLITLFSPSGYRPAIKGHYAERVMYLPLDDINSVRQFYKKYSPQKALLIRYDIWYNLIAEGLKQQTQFFLINARFTEDHFVFQWYGKPYLKLINSFNQVFCSDKNSLNLLSTKGFANTMFTGDTRYDRVSQIADEAKAYDSISTFKGSRKLMLLGSSWQEEEELLAKLVGTSPSELCYIIAPHDIKRSDGIKEKFIDYQPKLYTKDNFTPADSILILDTIGMLSSAYQYADFALVGGGFSGALHNILEPAVWGCHISFGPKVDKFPEALDFVNAGFALSVSNESDWIQKIIRLSNENTKLKKIKKNASGFVASNKGATSSVLGEIASE